MKCNCCKANTGDNNKFCPYCNSILETVIPQDTSSSVQPSNGTMNNSFVQNTQPVQSTPTPVMQNPAAQVGPQYQPVMQQPVYNQQTMVQQPVMQQPVYNQQTMMAPVQQPVQVVAPTPGVNPPIATAPKKKKPLLLIFILLLVIGILAFVGYSSLANDDSVDKPKEQQNLENEINAPEEIEVSENRKQSDRVIMLYVIGSDLESRGGAATKDISEIMKSNFNQDDIDILAYVGGTKDWQNDEFKENENAIYEVTNTEVTKVKTYDKKHMNVSTTLTEYLNYVYANYESDKYSLILWDHGGGPLNGYGVDENNPSKTMSIFDLNKALNDSMILRDNKLEFLGFDACLMSSIEVANMLKEEANYFIASSETEPGDGWDYSFLKEINKNTTTVQLGQYVIDYYDNFFKNQSYMYSLYGYDYNPAVSLSLIDLSKIDNVNSSINNLFKDMGEDITVESYSRLAREASRATFFGLDENGTTQTDLIDLYDFTSELEDYQTLVLPVQSALNEAVIYHKTNIEGCNGLSMYFPSTTRKYYDRVESNYKYGEMAVSENYTNFLKRYTTISSGDRLVKSSISELAPSVSSSNIEAAIPQDMANNYEYADYLLFRKIKEDGSYLPVLKSKDVSINGNKISATVSNRRIAVGNAKGEEVEDALAFEVSRDKNSVTYMLVAILEKWEDNDYLNTFEIEPVTIYLKVDNKTKKGSIVDIKKIQDEDDSKATGKVSYNLNDWRLVQFVSYSYILFGEDGKKLDEWQKTDTMYGTEVKIAEGYTFFADTLDKEEEYYYMFRVQDTQGNIYESNLVKAK
jgi:hypothetical protein